MSHSIFDKNQDAASYNNHASAYDTYIRRLAGPLAIRICELAHLKPGEAVLDVGTGTGLAARQASQIVTAQGSVLGVDLSAGMIDIAKRSVSNWHGASPDFRVMDAESLELSNASFDAVISLCAVRHFPNISAAIKEMYRVLKPGGQLVVSFGYARPINLLPLGRYIAKRLLGKVFAPIYPQIVGPVYLTNLAKKLLPKPKESLLTQWGESDPQGALLGAIHLAGFEGVKASWWGHEVVFDSAEEFWEAQTSIVTEVRKRIGEASPEAVARLKQEFLSTAQSILERRGQLIYPYGAFYVSAYRPLTKLS